MTTHVSRRSLRFESIDEVLADIDSIVAAAHAGTLHPSGNWKPGQILAHLAAWIEYGYNGYPMKTPWLLRMILRLMLPGILKNGMKPGVKIPGVRGGTTGQDDQPLDQAAERLRRAFLRLKNGEQCPHDSPGFGAMSHEDRIKLNLRHAELHLSFLRTDKNDGIKDAISRSNFSRSAFCQLKVPARQNDAVNLAISSTCDMRNRPLANWQNEPFFW